ncbi:MAG: hypothetical protein ACSLFP_15710 [Acidimicrobiales bacterium]
MQRTRAAASAAALVALGAVLAGAAFTVMREDSPAPTTTTTTSTTSTTVGDDEVAAVLADGLRRDLTIPLDATQAGCVAQAVVATVGRDRLEAIAAAADPVASLPDDDRSALLRQVVECVGPDTAAALLGTPTSTTTAPVAFPDAGEE